MKQSFLMFAALFLFNMAAAQTDSTMTTQLNRQVQNKSTMNKSSGNTQAPSTANIQDTRKAKKMVSTTPKGAIKVETDPRVTPPPPVSGTMPNNENTNTITPSVINGNKDGKDAGTKVPSP